MASMDDFRSYYTTTDLPSTQAKKLRVKAKKTTSLPRATSLHDPQLSLNPETSNSTILHTTPEKHLSGESTRPVSILSDSGTLVSLDSAHPSDFSHREHAPFSSALSRSNSNSTTTTLTVPAPSFAKSGKAYNQQQRTPSYDGQHFKLILQQLEALVEQFEGLNDQVLDAMCDFDEAALGLRSPFLSRSASPSLTSHGSSPTSSPSPDQALTEKGQPDCLLYEPSGLELDRQILAQSFTDQVLTAWSKLREAIASSNDTDCPPSPPPRRFLLWPSPKQDKKKHLKMAAQLKNCVVAFWGAQNNFLDRAQLVLDAFQDPSELESEDRVRILRSRHLHSLLSTTRVCIPELEKIELLGEKVRLDQDQMAHNVDRIHPVWMDILVVIK
ncbi:hypothetical protein BGW38_000128 [Lunasporangiospora selenospora]|uniref:Uncharacterized protein n=1 Tax=Lunasporangiospora selenospora TaxID=979761 RepID=A0A9P6KF22_9FUNG|nr:hypothetical protein BGW38_000128 [Lunasporangiospora selenospora]